MVTPRTLFILLILFFGTFILRISAQVTVAGSTGANGSYSTLGAAFTAINNNATQTGNSITVAISANTTEASIAALNSGNWTSLRIYPTATPVSISGDLSSELVSFIGSTKVTIDGSLNGNGSTRDLSIINTGGGTLTAAITILFKTNANHNTIQNCKIKGSGTGIAAGIIFFGTTSAVDGNGYNTINNNLITTADETKRPNYSIFGAGSSTPNSNTNNSITNNDFENFINPASSSDAINLSAFNSNYTITGNSFYETTTFGATGITAAIMYRAIYIGGGTNYTISGNYIGGSGSNCSGTWTHTTGSSNQNNSFTAIHLLLTAGGTTSTVENNFIQKISWTTTNYGVFSGIFVAAGDVNVGTVLGNSIGNNTTNSGSIYFSTGTSSCVNFGVYISSTGTVDVRYNKIGSITTVNSLATYSSNFYAINKTTTAGSITIRDNVIGSTTVSNSINFTTTNASNFLPRMIFCSGTGSTTISGNTISNIYNANTSNSSSGVALYGIYHSGGVASITNNTIYNLSTNVVATNGTAGCVGIFVAGTLNTAKTVTGNIIHDLSTTNTSFTGYVVGIDANGAAGTCTTTNTYSTNFIYNLSTSSTTGTAKLVGINYDLCINLFTNNILLIGGSSNASTYGFFEGTTAFDVSNTNTFYFNTVYISGTQTTNNLYSYCFFQDDVNYTRIIKDNIFANVRVNSGPTGRHYAISADAATITSDYNDLYIGGGSGNTYLAYDDASNTACTDIAAWRLKIGTPDLNSVSVNPSFASAGGTIATNYIPSAVTLTGVDMSVSTDYASAARSSFTMGAYNLAVVPGAPTAITATAGNAQAFVAFTAPVADGGSPILDYTATSSPGSITGTGSSSGIIVSGLTNGQSYTFTVKARNAVGLSTASVASNAVTPDASANIITVSSNTNISALTLTSVSDILVTSNATLTINADKTVNSVTVNPGSKLDLGTTNTLSVVDLILKAGKTTAPSVSVTRAMAVSGNLKLTKTLDNAVWYFMSFPSSVTVAAIVKPGTFGAVNTNWWIKKYNGSTRASAGATTTNWENEASATLTANQGYSIGIADALNDASYEMTFILDKTLVTTAESAITDRTVTVGTYVSAINDTHTGWNLVGIPYLSKFDANGVGATYITKYNVSTHSYDQYAYDDASLDNMNPFESFFIQASSTTLNFARANRQLAPRSVLSETTDKVKINFTTETGTDRTNLIIDENRTTAYEVNQDLSKWLTTGTLQPQIYSSLDGINYAYNALPLEAVQDLPLSVYSKVVGNATLSVDASQATGLNQLLLIDHSNNITTDLLTSDYSFTAPAGTSDGRFTISAQRIAKNTTNRFESKVEDPSVLVREGKLMIIGLNGQASIRVYDALGSMVVNRLSVKDVNELPLSIAGVYTVYIQCGTDHWVRKVIR